MKDLPRILASAGRMPTIALAAAITLLAGSSTTQMKTARAAGYVPLAVSQIPLTVSSPSHPQVLIAIGNSESMDGTLSGAIMTGSGSLGSALSTLQTSSSPANYSVPSGFSPPLQAADASGNAPFTVTQGSNLADNGASRLNVAKAGVQAIIQAYIQNTDFALETYSTSGTSLYSTWVYYMSAGSTFTFTSTQVPGLRYVNNPCFGYTTASATVKSNCTAIVATGYTATTVAAATYMQIGASSDDANINDVLYASGQPGVYINYGGTSPATPFPPNYSIGNYNSGNILITYNSSAPSANRQTGPTNAGYVPYSPQVMYAQRGFGYGGSQSANSGNVLVTMKSAGLAPTTSSVATAVNSFLPYFAPETNQLNTTEIKAVAGQAPTAGLLAKAKSYLATVTAASNGCTPTQYVVLISDGLPTQDLSGRYWPPLGSAAAVGYGMTATFAADGSLNTTTDQALTDTISSLAALKTAGIKTFIIGLGAGVDPTVNAQAAATLQAMAIAGGTTAYYPASSPAALVSDLNSILLAVQAGTLSTTSASVNSPQLTPNSVEYQSSFTSSDTPYQDWTGDLIAHALDPATGLPTGLGAWSAQAKLDQKAAGNGSSSRLIATWTPPYVAASGSAQPASALPFEWASLTSAQQAMLQPTDTLGHQRLDYLRGSSSLEKRSGGTFRNRSHILGDVVDSQPLYIGKPAGPSVAASYRTFVQSKAGRTPMLYMGANDGMLHAFNVATGVEQFAYVPYGVFSNLSFLTDPLYNQSHRYFVDAAPQAADVQFADNTWHSVVVAGLGAGGKTVYALDVTSPETITSETALASAVLWEFGDTDMGYSFGEPQTVAVNSPSKFAVFFGNGYNSANNTDVLYAVNPQTGVTIAKINLCAAVPTACNPSLPQGLSSVTGGNATGSQALPDTVVYAGDLQGNLWAIDVANSDPSAWGVRLLFQARDPSGAIQPITTAPKLSLHPNYPIMQGPLVIIGTGQLLTAGDLSTRQVQSAYGIWDKAGGASALTRASLQSQTLTAVSGAAAGLPQDVTTATNNPVDWTTKRGWYADLPVAGQRIVTPSKLLNGKFIIAVNSPPAATCNASFTSANFELNYSTGGAFSTPILDVNGDGVIDGRDTVNGVNNAVGISLGNGFASGATIVSGDSIFKKFTIAGVGSKVIKNLPPPKIAKVTWWQIQ